MTDDEWLAGLKLDQAYAGLDIALELAKCERWCKENRKLYSRRRAINWLNHAERPLAAMPAIQPARCAWKNQRCDEAVLAGSQYCAEHKATMKRAQEKRGIDV